jgi:hypothetical protein
LQYSLWALFRLREPSSTSTTPPLFISARRDGSGASNEGTGRAQSTSERLLFAPQAKWAARPEDCAYGCFSRTRRCWRNVNAIMASTA